ncbi:hypothetical protein A2773_04670 [Candidatus Gottesmanbacteria bacterium RIFCSPHIGHO2_01_FULL_39_10]|uniref:Phosphoglycerate mutase n=1 Tax=Candidatus Gottesmanbacteria bacterium RIFCSPHIGHO2_01_FULL_39_10 TaxID=1798375 RepID=A0A1F5ZS45_9BACT|nr:MAG: hypothetical protein A2773_04670 [Candidatus Gottesmanbacteria bacterium RIFCSPHIGHO2_01_FULL_39_10]
MTKFCTFYIVRHGETVWNLEKRIQGHGDSPLTAKGLKQIQKTAQKLKDVKFDAAFSSDLLRAKKTAEIILLERKLAVTTTEVLRERRFGKYEGKFFQEMQHLYEKIDKLDQNERFQTPLHEDIESDEALIGRFLTFLRETAVAYNGKIILIGSHGGLMKTLLIHLGFGNYKNLYGRFIANGAYIKLTSDGVDFFIEETYGIKKP